MNNSWRFQPGKNNNTTVLRNTRWDAHQRGIEYLPSVPLNTNFQGDVGGKIQDSDEFIRSVLRENTSDKPRVNRRRCCETRRDYSRMPSPLCSQHRRGLGVQLTPLPLDCFEHLSADHPELLVVHDVRLEPVLSGRHVPVVGSIRASAKYLVGTDWVAAPATAFWCLLLCAMLSSIPPIVTPSLGLLASRHNLTRSCPVLLRGW